MNFIMPSILLVVFAIALFSKDQEGINQIEMMMQNLPLMLLLLLFNLITILAGFYFSAALRLAHSTKYTIGIEMGLQNSALAIFIANQSLNSPQMSIVAVFYGSFTFFTTLALAYILKKRSG